MCAECDRPATVRGWCRRCYRRAWNEGNITRTNSRWRHVQLDEAVLVRRLEGDDVPMNSLERRELVNILDGQHVPRSTIAARLRIDGRQVYRDLLR